MTEEKLKNTKNRHERVTGFVYVALLFIVTTVLCCLCLSYYSGSNKTGTRKEFAIVKMDRIRQFQTIQSDEMVVVDSIYNRIKAFNPKVQASYEESDIKYYLNDIKSLYEKNAYDKRYKIFFQVSAFYNMWFADRKELWSKEQNIALFKKNLENCEIGLQKKQDELKNKK
ncbi:MAG: type VI secretion system transmembrane protein TssO [Dysgonamonadaceae bacterium]|jgi:hypothetical protein|nr:type VI secretion system transmembrane protein TssO [Dysgonamonadaceae bacterium]